MFVQIPGGWLADRFGGKWLLFGCVLLSSVVSLLSPTAARTHLGFFVFLQVLSGLGEGVMFPALHALIVRWSIPKYRSLVVSVIFTSTNAGIVIAMLVSGVLSDHGFAGGWPSVFYVLELVGCIWSAVWVLLCFDSPAVHPRISSTEREYWLSVLGSANLIARPPIPWRRILTSVRVWALAVAYFACIWGYYTLATCIPLFMHDVLGFDMTNNGILSAVPFFATVLMIPAGLLSDWLRSPGILSTNVVRKIFCVSGLLLTDCMLILTGHAGCDRALAVVLMFIAIGFTCLTVPVVVVNQLDLAPLHAGKNMGLTQFVANLSSIATPHAVGFLTYHRSSRSEWQNVFYLAAAISAVGAIVFVVFGSGRRQSWADTTDVNCQDVPTFPRSGEVENSQPYDVGSPQIDAINN